MKSKNHLSSVLLVVISATMGNMVDCRHEQPAGDCNKPKVIADCLKCPSANECGHCCNRLDPTGGDTNQRCVAACQQHYNAAYVWLNPGYDPLGARPSGQSNWDVTTYTTSSSSNYDGGFCSGPQALLAAEDSNKVAYAQVFNTVPSFMDTAETRAWVLSLTPCERLALLADVTRLHDTISLVNQADFSGVKDSIDKVVASVMAKNGQTGTQAYQYHVNRMVTGLWYKYVTATSDAYQRSSGQYEAPDATAYPDE